MIKAMITKAFLAKATAVLSGLTLATTGAGAADVLPQVAQDRVADAVEKVSALDLPDSKEAEHKADKAHNAHKAHKAEADEGEKAEKGEKPAKPARDNFGAVVSERARSTEDKGREFGQSVSAEARTRVDARREGVKPKPSP